MFGIFIGAVAQVHAKSLTHLADIESALDEGHRISVTVDLSACTPVGNAPVSKEKDGLTISFYRVTGDSSLSFSDNHITVTASNEPIQQFVRYHAQALGAVEFSAAVFSMPNFTLLNHIAYNCAIGNGINFI